jgi:hypothetical protein
MFKPCNMVINIKDRKNQWRISSDWYSIKLGTSRYQIGTKQWNGTGSASYPLHGCVQQRHRCTHLALETLMSLSDLRSTAPIIGSHRCTDLEDYPNDTTERYLGTRFKADTLILEQSNGISVIKSKRKIAKCILSILPFSTNLEDNLMMWISLNLNKDIRIDQGLSSHMN